MRGKRLQTAVSWLFTREQVLPSTCNLTATSCCFVPKAGSVCVAACDVVGGLGNLSCSVMLRTGLRQVAGSAPHTTVFPFCSASQSFPLFPLLFTAASFIRFAAEAAVRVLAAGISLTVGWGAEAPSLNPLGTQPLAARRQRSLTFRRSNDVAACCP